MTHIAMEAELTFGFLVSGGCVAKVAPIWREKLAQDETTDQGNGGNLR